MAKSKHGSNKVMGNTISDLRPASVNQQTAMNFFLEKQIVILEGLAGTGKTYIAVHHALKQFFSHKARRIILTRPLTNVGNEQLGFLPGEVNDKTRPYTEQFNEYIDEFMPMLQFSDEKKLMHGIEFIPLAYIRGRNFADSIIIADEMQNSTPLQMKTLLTRMAEGSQVIILGDTKQVDKVDGRNKNGLQDLVEKVKAFRSEDIGMVKFTKEDIRRSKIIKHVMMMYNDIDPD